MFDPIDIYCERLDPSFWAEPLNALSNAAFLLAAAALVIWARRAQIRPGAGGWFLIWMVAAIGIGSFLFHTHANHWSMLADVIPITIYKIGFLALYARYVMKLSRLRVVMLMLGFVMLGQSTYLIPKEILNGSLMYGPALLFLIAYGLYHRIAGQPEKNILLIAAGVFIASLTFRSIDMTICPHLAIGVHYMWHILNGVVLYLTTRAYIRSNTAVKNPSVL